MLILGIETSCDETAAAVVRDGREILSSEIFSQISLHRPFGGVVPELASREHLSRIGPIVDSAIEKAGISLTELDAIGVTQGPGLIGSLMVGVSYARGLAFGLDRPCYGVNHIEGHVCSVNFENPPVEYPALALIVSGGHTNLFNIPEEGRYILASRTRDDAAGEAFDKVAKMLGLGYPGGPIIERISRAGDRTKARFPKAKISDGKPDFSFSGLKTAVARYVRENSIQPVAAGSEPAEAICDIAAGFQATVVESLVGTMAKVSKDVRPRTLIVAGGVACNEELRSKAASLAKELGIPVFFPSKHLSTDNAAMIAAAAYGMVKRGAVPDPDLAPDVTLRLHEQLGSEARLRERGVPYRL